ncbi:hypothetical protein ACVXHB_11600 [Escherichia coli]
MDKLWLALAGAKTRKFTDVRNQPSAIGDNGRQNQTLAVSLLRCASTPAVSMTILRSHVSFIRSCCLMYQL